MKSKPFSRLEKSLTTGNLWLYIFSLIQKKGSVYAYNLNSEIDENFGFRSNRVMIYIILYKLESEGLIESSFKERRKYYKFTEKGKREFRKAKEYLSVLSDEL